MTVTPRQAALPLLFLPFGAGLALASAADLQAQSVDLPSGVTVHLQEKIEDLQGDYGVTLRFRYVMPDLSKRAPATTGSATDFPEDDLSQDGTPQDRQPIEISTEDGADGEDVSGDYIDDGMVSAEDLHLVPVIAIPGAEEAADDAIDLTGRDFTSDEALPAAPDILLKDPVHDDIVWICENLALPEALKSSKRPQQIIISLADRESPFGVYDPDVLQIFESYTLPKDRDICEWRPW